MGAHAKRIADRDLVKLLKKSAGRDDIPAEDVEKLVALVNDVADIAGPLLERIPQIFKQYTEHNIEHCRNIIGHMGRFIPRETLKRLNALELTVLILSALLHDFGMFVSQKEKQEALASPDFESFRAGHPDRAAALEEARGKGDHVGAEVIQDALLAEYFRRMHPERVRRKVEENLPGKLVYGDKDISKYVLDVCESHAWGVHESHDPRYENKAVSKLRPDLMVYNVPLNLQYIACCLRLADILDFDRSRTPLVVFKNQDFTEEKSWEEWNKHLSVVGWKIDERDVRCQAECEHPAFYVAVMEFLDAVDSELGQCRRLLVKEAPADIAARYKLHLLPVVDRSGVEMADKNYLAGAFRFQLEYDRIMKLLMDKSLYPDPSLFLRELLQNSLDACRNREAHARDAGREGLYDPRIAVWDRSGDPERPRVVFQDNGVGMTRKIVENYFMRVGRSYYRSPEFDTERARLKKKGIDLEATSQFGIGILSCFMVADRFEVETYRHGHQPLHITIEGPTKYFTIKLLPKPTEADFTPRPADDSDDGPPRRPGTRITVHLRPGAAVKVFETLNTFAVNVEYDINVYPAGAAPEVIPRHRWEEPKSWPDMLRRAFEESHHTDDDEEEKVAENFKDVLAASVIPLSSGDFSPRLRGDAWLWLLSDGAAVCPKKGYLKMTQAGLVVTGLPVFLSESRRRLSRWKGTPDAPSRVQDYLSGRLERDLMDDDRLRMVEILGEEGKLLVSLIVRRWGAFSPLERRVFVESLLLNFNDERGRITSRREWQGLAGVAKELLNASHGWASKPLHFSNSPVYLGDEPRDIALHGIYLPAGLLSWEPMTGSSSKLDPLLVPGGVQLDLRGFGVPTPAASRLFVDSTEADKVINPLARAVLRHAFQLPADNPSAPGWDEWLHELVGVVASPRVILDEYGILSERLKFEVMDDDGKSYLSRSEVVEKIGRWAPVRGYKLGGQYESRHGLELNRGTVALIASKVIRQREDGFWEVDMESDVPVELEPLQELFDKARKMTLIHAP